EEKDIVELLSILKKYKNSIKVKSILSHLAGSENPAHDNFTKQQINLFKTIYKKITTALGYRPLRHILNSGGIIRFPENQMDMVRLGIGLYGIDESGILRNQLRTVNTLKATISQIKNIEKGETIGYGRMGKATKKMRIATLSIGYADGLLRKAGNGNYHVLIRGEKAPIIGNVCMDMTMVEVTPIPDAHEGDEVIIFGADKKGNELPVQELAKSLDTIPYEIFTSISKRVKRVYVQE
ncbi:MAG: alanine racemase, partial [Bacteroidota bacterium]